MGACHIVLFASTIVLTLIVIPKISSQVSQFWEGSTPQYARMAHDAKKPLVVYQLRKPSLPFYYRSRVVSVSSKEELQSLTGQYYLIAGSKNLDFLKAKGCKIISADNNFALLVSPQ